MSTSGQDATESGNETNLRGTSRRAPEKRIQLRKKSVKELEEMATAKGVSYSCESVDENEPALPRAVPSEPSMSKLTTDLKKNPVVKAFDTAEKKLEEH